MLRRLTNRSTLVALLLMFIVVTGELTVRVARAQSISQSTWIRNVPENASFYWTMNRLGEQCQALLQSTALKNLVALTGELGEMIDLENLDLVDLVALIDDNDADDFVEWASEPENRQLIDVVMDMLSHEVFMVGGPEWSPFAGAYADFTSGMYKEMARALREGEGDAEPDVRNMFSPETLEKLEVPATLIGFKVSDRQAARAQLARLKLMLPLLMQEEPELARLIELKTIAGSEFLCLEADGTQIPWDEIPEDEENAEALKALKPIIEKKTIAVSLGMLDDYILLSFGKSNDHLEQLGEGRSLLERSEMARLRAQENERICSAIYVSEDLARQAYSVQRYLQDMASLLASLLHHEDVELDDMLRRRIERDVAALADDISSIIPRPGAALSYSFLTDQGYEGYSQSWVENIFLDGTQPLPLVNHVGGDPLVAVVARSKYKPEYYATFVKWLKKIDGYVHEFALRELDGSDQEDYETARKLAMPTLARMDTAMSTMIIPALRDGQSAFVLDAKLTSNQWHVLMPASEQPLAMLEPAFVYGVSDAPLLKKGVSEIFASINDLLTRAREEMPDQVPPFAIPPPQVRESAHGELFFYPLLGALGGDPRIAPAAGLAQDVAVLALSTEHAERILSPTPPVLGTFFGQYAQKPVASVSHCNWAGLVDAVVPWVEYGMSQGVAEDLDADSERVFATITATADFLRCLHSISSVTFLEGDSIVSHHVCHMQDVAK